MNLKIWTFVVCVCVFVGFWTESTPVPISQETSLLYSGCQAFGALFSILHPPLTTMFTTNTSSF